MNLKLHTKLWLRLVLVVGWVLLLTELWSTALGQGSANTNADGTTGSRTNRALSLLGGDFVQRHADEYSFGLSSIPALQVEFLGNPLWKYVASISYVLLAFTAAKLVDWLIHTRLKKWAESTPSQWDDVVVGLVDGPVKVITFVLLLHVGLQIFHWPAWVSAFLSNLFFVAVAYSVVMVLLRIIDAVERAWRKRLDPEGDLRFNEQFLVLIGKLLKIVIAIVAILTVLPVFGVSITGLLGSVSIIGLALGLAAQDTVANLFGAVSVFVDQPFRVGDRIQVAGVDGTVEEMGLRATTVRSQDGYLITVPNKMVGSNTVVNISRRTSIKTEMNFSLPYDLPVPRIRRALQLFEETYRAHDRTEDLTVTFNKFNDSWLNVQVVHWWRGVEGRQQLADLQALNLQVKERFDAEGIAFAYPTQTLKIEGLREPG